MFNSPGFVCECDWVGSKDFNPENAILLHCLRSGVLCLSIRRLHPPYTAYSAFYMLSMQMKYAGGLVPFAISRTLLVVKTQCLTLRKSQVPVSQIPHRACDS